MQKITKIYFTTTISLLGTYILELLYVFLRFSLDLNFLSTLDILFTPLFYAFGYILLPVSLILFFSGFSLLRSFKEDAYNKKYIRIAIYINLLLIVLFFASIKVSLA